MDSVGCTSETEKTRRSRSKVGADAAPAASVVVVEPAAVVEPAEGEFAKALLMIASLPLSAAEKAEAVRRLLKSKGEA